MSFADMLSGRTTGNRKTGRWAWWGSWPDDLPQPVTGIWTLIATLLQCRILSILVLCKRFLTLSLWITWIDRAAKATLDSITVVPGDIGTSNSVRRPMEMLEIDPAQIRGNFPIGNGSDTIMLQFDKIESYKPDLLDLDFDAIIASSMVYSKARKDLQRVRERV